MTTPLPRCDDEREAAAWASSAGSAIGPWRRCEYGAAASLAIAIEPAARSAKDVFGRHLTSALHRGLQTGGVVGPKWPWLPFRAPISVKRALSARLKILIYHGELRGRRAFLAPGGAAEGEAGATPRCRDVFALPEARNEVL